MFKDTTDNDLAFDSVAQNGGVTEAITGVDTVTFTIFGEPGVSNYNSMCYVIWIAPAISEHTLWGLCPTTMAGNPPHDLAL